MLTRGITLILLMVGGQMNYAQPQLKSGFHSPSPNGKFSVFYEAPKFQIRDTRTFAVLGLVSQEQPVLALRWSGDSKTLVIVEHIANGSDAYFFHWDGSAWKPQFVNDQFGKDVYHAIAVVDVNPQQNEVDVTYKTLNPTRLICFTFTPARRKVSNLRRRDISFQHWKRLSLFPVK